MGGPRPTAGVPTKLQVGTSTRSSRRQAESSTRYLSRRALATPAVPLRVTSRARPTGQTRRPNHPATAPTPRPSRLPPRPQGSQREPAGRRPTPATTSAARRTIRSRPRPGHPAQAGSEPARRPGRAARPRVLPIHRTVARAGPGFLPGRVEGKRRLAPPRRPRGDRRPSGSAPRPLVRAVRPAGSAGNAPADRAGRPRRQSACRSFRTGKSRPAPRHAPRRPRARVPDAGRVAAARRTVVCVSRQSSHRDRGDRTGGRQPAADYSAHSPATMTEL